MKHTTIIIIATLLTSNFVYAGADSVWRRFADTISPDYNKQKEQEEIERNKPADTSNNPAQQRYKAYLAKQKAEEAKKNSKKKSIIQLYSGGKEIQTFTAIGEIVRSEDGKSVTFTNHKTKKSVTITGTIVITEI